MLQSVQKCQHINIRKAKIFIINSFSKARMVVKTPVFHGLGCSSRGPRTSRIRYVVSSTHFVCCYTTHCKIPIKFFSDYRFCKAKVGCARYFTILIQNYNGRWLEHRYRFYSSTNRSRLEVTLE